MSKIGRPSLPKEYRNQLVGQLEPFLKSGLSIRKACLQSGVSRSKVNYYLRCDNDFSNQIHLYMQYVPLMINNALFRELLVIVKRQNEGLRLDSKDVRYLQWYALNSSLAREEFGRRAKFESYDPEVEIARIGRMIDEAAILNN